MNIEWPTIIQGAIPFLGGLYGTALGFGLLRLPGLPHQFVERYFSHLRWIGPLVAIFAVFTGWQSHSYIANPSASDIARNLAAKASLPMRIDEITTLHAIDAVGHTITFHNSIAHAPQSKDERARIEAVSRKQILAFACGNAEILQYVGAGYVMEWRYRLNDGDEISISVNQSSCAP